MYYGWSLRHDLPQSKLQKYTLRKTCEFLFKKSKDEILSEPNGIMGAYTVVLANDMLTIKSEPIEVIPNRMKAYNTKFEGQAFYEGASIRKINNLYYFIYSSEKNHELCYAISKSPDSGFKFGGTIISNGDVGYNNRNEEDRLSLTATNHGSIECVDGSYYVFYHRNTHGSRCSRQSCAEPINIKEDGSITQVEITSQGLNNKPLVAKGNYEAAIACNLTNGKMPHLMMNLKKKNIPQITSQGNETYIKNIKNKALIGYKFFEMNESGKIAIVTRGYAKGILRVSLEADGNLIAHFKIDSNKQWNRQEVEYTSEQGKQALYFKFYGRGSLEFKEIKFN